MNLNTSDGTRSENGVTRGYCGEHPKRIKDEYERIKMEISLEGLDGEWALAVWRKASQEMRDFLVSECCGTITEEKIMATIKSKVAEREEIKERNQMQKELNEKEEQIKILEERILSKEREMLEERVIKLEKELEAVRSNNSVQRKAIKCYACGRIGHTARFCRETMSKFNSNYRFKEFYLERNDFQHNQDVRELSKLGKRSRNNELDMLAEASDKSKRIKRDQELLGKLQKLVRKEKEEIKYCEIEKCSINTINGTKVYKKGQNIPQAMLKRTLDYIEDLETRKVIRRSESSWRNPIRAIEKSPGGEIRLVSNLMMLNDIVEKDEFELANIRDVIRATQGSKFFTVLDLKEGFYHVEIVEKDKYKTAFEINGKVFEWNSMTMGFKNAPQMLQRIMNKIMEGIRGNGVEIYMDDIVIHAEKEKDHDILLQDVIRRLEVNNMKINPEKIQFKKKEIKLLGVTLNGTEQEASEIKKNEALEYPIPKNVSELRRFLGLTGWFRNFIAKYAEKTNKLTDGLKGRHKAWEWTKGMQEQFETIKQEVSELKKLLLANYNKEFMLRTDASLTGLGAVLLQKDDKDEWRPVQWASKKLTPAESRYGITEREMYAVFWGIKKFEYELRGRRFKLITDHKALEEIRRKAEFNNSRVNRWIEIIQEFDFEVHYNKGEELAAPDALSRLYENERGVKIKEGKMTKHRIVDGEKEFWIFDNGERRWMPEKDKRKEILMEAHKKVGHKGLEATYYSVKSEMYWPGIRKDIEMLIKECNTCQRVNRKTTGGSEFITTSRPMEKIGIDLMFLNDPKTVLMVIIDYFSRMLKVEILKDKSAESITEALKKCFENGYRPVEIITDNGREFCNERVKKLVWEYGIEHHKAGIEAHRSNGRVERVIRSIRDGLERMKEGTIRERVERIVEIYNNSYHAAIRCAPKEAFYDDRGEAQMENSRAGLYQKRFKMMKREKFLKGQKVRITSHENLKDKTKNEKGRFYRNGVIIDVCDNDSYLVKEDDKIFKKNHYDLKGIH
ncbi:hypothetical protein ENBRE01_2475 [Enteropsectra breve]|nr:hypothetical protein ENBRE01_2475 [Enteropsectra breve]